MKSTNWNFRLGLGIVGAVSAVALLAPLLAPYDPMQISLTEELCKPGAHHLLGCDSNGTDILSILIYGARISIEVGFTVTFISVFVGLMLGSIAGYFGGWRDAALMRLLDVIFAFPGTILAIAIASMLGPSKGNLILCLSLTGWAGYARLVRGEVRAIRGLEYVEAARALGVSNSRIFIYHLWPNIFSPLIVTATFGIAGTILAEAGLSFLGIGVPPGTPSWGSLLNFGRDVLLEAPFVSAFPGLAIMLTVLGFHLLGEGLLIKLDPRVR
ncbi:MAG: ABC transporter permease [Bdellovibrionota bacterium]